MHWYEYHGRKAISTVRHEQEFEHKFRVDTIKNGDTLSLGRNQIALLGATVTANFLIKPGEVIKLSGSLGVRPIGSNSKSDDVVESETEVMTLTAAKPKTSIAFKWFGRDTRVAAQYQPFSTAQWAYPSGTMITGPYFVSPGSYELKTYVIAFSAATPIEKTYLNFKIENLRPDYMQHIPKTISQIDKEHIT